MIDLCLKDWQEHFNEPSVDSARVDLHSRNPYSTGDVWITFCSFAGIHSFSSGGVIYYESTKESKMLVDLSSFDFCTGYSNGGAIFFGNEGECVLDSLCSYYCTTNAGRPSGQFCWIVVSSDSKTKNEIFDSSIIASKKQAWITMYYQKGNFSCKRINVSNNEIDCHSGIVISNPSISLTSFSTFNNNSASGYNCIWCSSITHQITHSNMIKNNQIGNSFGIIYAENAEIEMNHCYLLENANNNHGTVFYANLDGSKIICFNCSLTDDQKDFIGQVSFTISAGFINSYQYLEFEKCDASLLFGRKINIEGNHLSLIVLQSVLLLYFPVFSYSKSLKFMCFM